MLDLHTHTTHSDGTLTPDQLLSAAQVAGLRVLAITDHDTLSGWQSLSPSANLEIIPGVELSTVHRGRSLHLLGYFPDPEQLAPPLQERIAGRRRRAQEMATKLAALGYPIQLPKLQGNMAPGRPHIAKALVEAGYVRNAQDAFERWLGENRPAYVEYEKFSAVEGIQLLRQCGAVPVWAHPFLFSGGEIEAVLKELVAAGLLGVEVYHPCHTLSQRRKLQSWCAETGLIPTGGSDYHGPQGEKQLEETHLNQFHLPLSWLEPLQLAAQTLKTQV